MIDANEPTNATVVKQETPAQITTTMIINDLENGIDRPAIQAKYNLEAWEVKQMFMHPSLKGKKAKKVRKLSFTFVDDTLPLNSGDIAVEQAEMIDPNQTSIPVQTRESFDNETRIEEGLDHKGELTQF